LYQTINYRSNAVVGPFIKVMPGNSTIVKCQCAGYFPLSKDAGNPFGNLFQTIPAPGSEEIKCLNL
jgi:hypothetical protein